MVLDEIQNTSELWENSSTNFMPIPTIEDTMLIYGESFGELLKQKIKLMTVHQNDNPYIDPNLM